MGMQLKEKAMKTEKMKQRHWALAWCAGAALAACGGGGGAPLASNTVGTPAVQVATFIDAPVAGLEYSSTSTSGLTASDYLDGAGKLVKQAGNFEFVPGETVSFYAGNLLFGTVEMREGMTEIRPTDLVPGADATEPRVVRMLQTLQSLDSDGDPSNGITIADGDRAHMRNTGKHIDLRDKSVSDEEVKQVLPTVGYTVDATAAVEHFKAHLDDESNAHNGFTPPSAVGADTASDNAASTSGDPTDDSASSGDLTGDLSGGLNGGDDQTSDATGAAPDSSDDAYPGSSTDSSASDDGGSSSASFGGTSGASDDGDQTGNADKLAGGVESGDDGSSDAGAGHSDSTQNDDSANAGTGSSGGSTTPVVTPGVPTLSTNGRLLASNCFQCHGTGGTGGFESIRGGEASEVFEYFNGQEGAANRSIMTAHAQGFTQAQLQAIVAYLKQ